MGASVWADEWQRGNKWADGAGEGNRCSRAGRWATLSPNPLPTPPLRPLPPGGCSWPPCCPQPPGTAGRLPRGGRPGGAQLGDAGAVDCSRPGEWWVAIPRVPAARSEQDTEHGVPLRVAVQDGECRGLALPGWGQGQAVPWAAREGRQPPGTGRHGSRKGGSDSSTQESRHSSRTMRRPESHVCRARPPSPTSPAGKEQLPLVETPHPPMVGHVLHVTPRGLRGRAGEAGGERNGWEKQPVLQLSKIKHLLNHSGNGEVM